jgi:hypothetical protein
MYEGVKNKSWHAMSASQRSLTGAHGQGELAGSLFDSLRSGAGNTGWRFSAGDGAAGPTCMEDVMRSMSMLRTLFIVM